MTPLSERDLYDPEQRRWYRGTAVHTTMYFDHTRSQFVTVDVDRFPDSKCSCDECESAR